MKPRDRVLLAIEHEEPDRVPLDYWSTPKAYFNLKKHLGIYDEDTVKWAWMEPMKVCDKVLERLHVDFRRIYMKRPQNWITKKLPDGSVEDEFGRRYRWVGDYLEFMHYCPLAKAEEVEDIEEYPWPDPYAPGRTEGLRREAKELYEKTDYAIFAFPYPYADFELAWNLMGFTNFLKYLITNQKFVTTLLDKVCEIAIGLYDVLLDEVGHDIQVVYGPAFDFAHQHGMYMSPELWRKVFKPRFKKVYDFVKKKAPHVKIFLHSCGAMSPVIGDLVEIGLDVLNPIQPLAHGMNSKTLKQEFGKEVCFHGGIDLQHVMSFRGSIQNVEEEVRRRIRALAPGGGYILAPAHNLQPDTTPEKIVAMYDYAVKYGVYPIKVK